MSKMSEALANVARPIQPREDKLEALRLVVRAHRDLMDRIAALEEELKAARKSKWDMESRTLPDMFGEAGVDHVGIPAEGNMPSYDAVLSPYYHANIPPDQKEEAFEWLEREGHGDIIKTTVRVELGRGEREKAKTLENWLQRVGIEYSRDLGVPWNTLTAWLKEQIEKGNHIPPLSLIGATVGHIVRLKERKVK